MNIQHDPGGVAGTPIFGDDLAHLRALRHDMERGLEAMLQMLDFLDGDPDLEGTDAGHDADLEPDEDNEEDDGREPNLGATESINQLWWSRSGQQDLEAVNEDGGNIEDQCQLDDADDEPSLGAPEQRGEGDQREWAAGDTSDGESSCVDDDNPTVNEAARKRAYAERERTEAAGREADRQLRQRTGAGFPGYRNDPTASNVRIIGPDFRQYAVTRL